MLYTDCMYAVQDIVNSRSFHCYRTSLVKYIYCVDSSDRSTIEEAHESLDAVLKGILYWVWCLAPESDFKECSPSAIYTILKNNSESVDDHEVQT